MEHQKALHAERQIDGVKAAVSGWTDNELQGLRWQLGGASLDHIKATMQVPHNPPLPSLLPH
jgi:hypothetical protein